MRLNVAGNVAGNRLLGEPDVVCCLRQKVLQGLLTVCSEGRTIVMVANMPGAFSVSR